jgi:tetratricopeptide (TPR) repeat protein
MLCASSLAQGGADYAEYLARIAGLQQQGDAIVQARGRGALIELYRDLIETYPDYENNIRLETQIAMLYQSDLGSVGEPPDPQSAYETYLHITRNYDPEHPYMKEVRWLAAEAARAVDSQAAAEMYQGIIRDYPEEDALVVKSYYGMARLAEEQGDMDAARQYYDAVLTFAPSGSALSNAEASIIETLQANAAASLIADAVRGADTPEERLKALRKFVEKRSELAQAHADLVQRFAQTIERQAGGDRDSRLNAAFESLFASLKSGAGTGANDVERMAARTDRTRPRRGGGETDQVRDMHVARNGADRLTQAAIDPVPVSTTSAETAPSSPWRIAVVAVLIGLAAGIFIGMQRRRRA